MASSLNNCSAYNSEEISSIHSEIFNFTVYALPNKNTHRADEGTRSIDHKEKSQIKAEHKRRRQLCYDNAYSTHATRIKAIDFDLYSCRGLIR